MPDYEREKMQTVDIWAAEQGLRSLPGPLRRGRVRRRRSGGAQARRDCISKGGFSLLPPHSADVLAMESKGQRPHGPGKALGRVVESSWHCKPFAATRTSSSSLHPKASSELQRLPGATKALTLLSLGEKIEKDVIAAINH